MSSPPPLTVSVVVSSYNYAPYVEEAIRSVLGQTRVPDEIIVVDDGSSDGSPELICQRFADEPRVRLIEQTNGGQLAAWMTGFAASSGDLILLLDSDDRWSPDYVARVHEVYQTQPSVDFVYTNMRLFGAVERPMLRDRRDRDLGLSVLLGAYVHRWQGTATSALSLRRTLMARILALPPEMAREWVSRPDDCLIFGGEILGAHKYFIAAPLVDHREHARNALASYQRSTLNKARYVFRSERMLQHYRDVAGITPRWLRLAKMEFRTKPHPTFAELRCYWRLLGEAPMPWLRRLEHRLALVGHYCKGLSR